MLVEKDEQQAEHEKTILEYVYHIIAIILDP